MDEGGKDGECLREQHCSLTTAIDSSRRSLFLWAAKTRTLRKSDGSSFDDSFSAFISAVQKYIEG